MEFKIILSEREISLDLALYTTLALFVIILLAVFFWIFITCQSSNGNNRTCKTIDYYPVHIGRRHSTLPIHNIISYEQFGLPMYQKFKLKNATSNYLKYAASNQSSSYKTNSTVCELPIVEV